MAADLNLLDPNFALKCKDLLQRCATKGMDMRPNEGLRDPWKQAKYWRQSRSIEQINDKVSLLRNKGANYLADIIVQVGPQHGDPVTNSLPGASWHQWGSALDCFWLVNGAAEWSTQKLVNGKNGYKVYAAEAVGLGLTAGGLWATFKDWPHVQEPSAASPLSSLNWAEIDDAMRSRFPSPLD
jgi:peptidoglycan LD-endopeptidase CwlK